MQDHADPFAPIRVPINSLGGNLLNAFFTKDSYDVLALTEFPDSVSPDDISIAFYAGGAVATIHTAVLLTATQANDAKSESGSRSYRLVPRSAAQAASA